MIPEASEILYAIFDNMKTFDDSLQNRLIDREKKGLLRTLKLEDRSSIDFTSNDYLGLAQSSELFEEIQNKISSLNCTHNGATGSRLLSGNSNHIQETEHQLSRIFNSESTLIFNSGYSANLAVLSSLPQRNDTVIYDELAHICIKDGARLSLAKRLSFRHNDLNDLESKIRKATGSVYIAVESVYSMDGDECPLTELVALCEKFNASIILDEAHSTGVRGKLGGGLAVSLGLEKRIAVRVYTFGKGMGVHGACVAGSTLVQRYLINFARPFIYTTALPPHSIIAIGCAFDYLAKHSELQDILTDKVTVYLKGIFDLENRTISKSSIQNFLLSGNENVKFAALTLQQNGFDVRAILSPTVASGSERLRICLHTFNSDEDIIELTRQLKQLSVTS